MPRKTAEQTVIRAPIRRILGLGPTPSPSCHVPAVPPAMTSATAPIPSAIAPGARHSPSSTTPMSPLSVSWRAAVSGMVREAPQVWNPLRSNMMPMLHSRPLSSPHARECSDQVAPVSGEVSRLAAPPPAMTKVFWRRGSAGKAALSSAIAPHRREGRRAMRMCMYDLSECSAGGSSMIADPGIVVGRAYGGRSGPGKPAPVPARGGAPPAPGRGGRQPDASNRVPFPPVSRDSSAGPGAPGEGRCDTGGHAR